METINAEVKAQNSFVPSSSQHTRQLQTARSGANIIEVQSVHTIHPWNPALSRIGYWTEQPAHSPASITHRPPALEIHLCHIPLGSAIRRVCAEPSSAPVTATQCEPDSTSAAFGNEPSESIDLTTTMADEPVTPPSTLCKKKNQHVVALLEQCNYLPSVATSNDDDTMFASELIVSAVRFVNHKNPEDVERYQTLLVRGILRDCGCYGGQADEAITPDYAKQILRRWIACILFNAPIEDLIVQHLASIQPATIRTQELATWLRATTRMLLRQGVVETCSSHPLLSKTECWIWENVHFYVAPLLIYSEHDPDLTLLLADPQWGQMHAGFLFAIQCSFDINTISKELALETGKLLMRALETSNCIFDVHDYFDLPIRCYQVQAAHLQAQPPPLDEAGQLAMSTRALHSYVDAANQAALTHPSIVPLQEALKDYQTRPQIAEKIINEHCPGTNIGDLLNTSEGLLLNTVQLSYGDPSRQFSDQFGNILNAFNTLDKVLIAEAFNRLEKQEIEFISHASVQFAQGDISTIKCGLAPYVSLPPLLPLARMVLRLNPIKTENFFLDLIEGIDIFVASTPKEQRVYALEIHHSGYDLKRIVTHDQKRLVTNSTIKLISNQQTLHDVTLRDVVLLPEAGKNGLHELLNNIGLQHQYRFYLHLHFRGIASVQPDAIECISASFDALYNCLDDSVKSYILSSRRIGVRSPSDEESQVLPATTTEIICARMAGANQIYAVTKLTGKQYNNKDIYVQINPRNGMLFGYKFTLSEHHFLEPVPFDRVQSLSPTSQRNHMADVASGSRLCKDHQSCRQAVGNHASRPLRKALTNRNRVALPDNTEALAIARSASEIMPPQVHATRAHQADTPVKVAALVLNRSESPELPVHLQRWGCIVTGKWHRSRQPDTTGHIDLTTNSPPQERRTWPQQQASTSGTSALHSTNPASTMAPGPHQSRATASTFTRGVEPLSSGPEVKLNLMPHSPSQTGPASQLPGSSRKSLLERFEEYQLPAKKRTRQISIDSPNSPDSASMAVTSENAQNQ